MNKVGINCADSFGRSAEENLKVVAEQGFDAVFTEFKNIGFVENFAKLAQQTGVCYECVHAPFKGINNIWLDNEEGERILSNLCACVDACHNADIPVTVVHLSSGKYPPRMNDLGFSRFDKLVDRAVKQGVTLACENQRKLANITYMFETYDDVEQVRFCWYVGHEGVFADGREYMPLFGHKLVYTHIHDNFSKPGSDLHMIPFDGGIDYTKVVRYLKNVNFSGTLTLEVVPNVWDGYKGMTPEGYYQKAYNAIIRIRNMLNETFR